MYLTTLPLHLRRLLLSSSALTGIALISTGAEAGQALPTGGVVTAGTATIAQPNAKQLTVTTGTQNTVIDWSSFSIASGNKVTIQQPGTSSITVNEVTGPDPSQIFGDLSSNGRVVLANPNGIWFGPDSHVDVAGLVASTATLSADAKQAFAAGGRLSLDVAGKANASIQNDGKITIANEGLAALVAPGVRNNGVIQATLGTVQLASGTTSTLDFYGDGLVSLAVTSPVQALAIGPDGKPFNATIENNGKLKAGQVLVTASVVKGVVDNSINMSGVTEAKGVTVSGGDIVLDGGDGAVTVAGTLDASSQQAQGGNVQVTGGAVTLASTAKIDVSGAKGGGTVEVGGGPHGGGTLKHATTTTVAQGASIKANATKQGNGGNVAVWSDGLTTFNGSIEAKGAGTGNGGWVETSGHYLSIATGTVDASAPNGAAGTWLLDPYSLDVVSGTGTSTDSGTDSSAAGGTTILDSTINNDLAFENVTLQTGGAGGNITIDTGAAITWSNTHSLTLNSHANGGTGDIIIDGTINTTNGTLTLDSYHSVLFNAPVTIGGAGVVVITTNDGGSGGDYSFATGASLNFTGVGQSLTINAIAYSLLYSATDLQDINNNLGAFHYALANSIDLTSVSWTPIGTDSGGNILNSSAGFAGTFTGLGHAVSNLTINSGNDYIGLFGVTSGTVRDIGVVNANITGEADVGALVGMANGPVLNAFATGQVAATNSLGETYSRAGGLIGVLNTATVQNSYAMVTVSGGSGGGANANVGGLIGEANNASVLNSFATGMVSAPYTDNAGGLIGAAASVTITNAYATGAVTSNHTAGGLVGNAGGSTFSNVYATGYVSTSVNGGGLVGSDGSSTATYAYWDAGTTGLAADGLAGTTSASTTTLQSALPSGFSASVWGIIPGQSYPYLKSFYPTAPQVVSGTALDGMSPVAGGSVALYAAGAPTGYTSSTGANGYFNILLPAATLQNGGTPITAIGGTLVQSIGGGVAAASAVDGASLTSGQITLNFQLSGITETTSAATYSAMTPLATIFGSSFYGTIVAELPAGPLTILASGPFTVDVDPNLSLGLTIVDASTITLASSITTMGDQNYLGPVVINNNPTLTANASTYNGGNVNFSSTIDGTSVGGQSLTIMAAGSVSFGDDIGDAKALGSLNVTASGEGPYITLPSAVTTVGAQTYNGSVLLANDTILTTTGAGGNVDFEDTIDSANYQSPASLTVTATGTITVAGDIGDNAVLNNLTLNAASVTVPYGASLTTSGAQTYNGPVTLGGDTTFTSDDGSVSFDSTLTGIGGAALTVSATGSSATVTFDHDVSGVGSVNVTAYANVAFYGSLAFGNTASLTSNYNSVLINGAVDANGHGDPSLTVSAPYGTAQFGGPVGGSSPLDNLSVTGLFIQLNSVHTTGTQLYMGPVTVSGPTTLRSDLVGGSPPDAIEFQGTLDGGQDVTITATGGTVSFDQAVGSIAPLNSLSVTAAGISLNSVQTVAGQSYTGPAILSTATTLESISGGTIAFLTAAGTIDGAQSLTVMTSGAVEFDGAIGAKAELADFDVSAGSLIGSLPSINAAMQSISYPGYVPPQDESGSVSYDSLEHGVAIVLTGNTTITGNASEALAFTAPIDGGYNLTLTVSGGTITLTGLVGSQTPLASLTVTAAGIVLGTTIKTTGGQSYQGPVTLSGATALQTTDNALVHFAGTVDGGQSLNITGSAEFDSAVGGGTPLASLSVSGPVTLGAVDDNTIVATGNITLGGTLDVSQYFANVTITSTSGVVSFGGPIGGDSDIGAFVVTGAAINLPVDNGEENAVSTDGTQSYNGPVTVSGTTTLSSEQDIDFSSTLDGIGNNEDVTLNPGGNVNFAGAVTPVGGHGLGSLTILYYGEGVGAITLGSVTTTDSNGQSYASAVTLNSDTVLSAGSGPVTFQNSIDGPHALTVTTTGTITTDGAIGGQVPLTTLALSGSEIELGAVTTTGSLTLSSANILLITEALSVGGSLDATAASGLTVEAPITVTGPDAGVSLTSTGNGVSIYPAANIIAPGPITISAVDNIYVSASLSSTGSSISLNSSQQGISIASGIDISAAGTVQAGVGNIYGFYLQQNSTISGGTGVLIYDNSPTAGSVISISGTITAPAIELLAATPGANPSTPGEIHLNSGSVFNTTGSSGNNAPNYADTIFYAGPGGTIDLDHNVQVNGGAGNVAFVADTLNTANALTFQPYSTISTSGTVILSPASSDGVLMGALALPDPFETNPSAVLDNASPGGASVAHIGVGTQDETFSITQSLANLFGGAAGGTVGTVQIGLPGNSTELYLRGAINFPSAVAFEAGNIIVQSDVVLTNTVGDMTFVSTQQTSGQSSGLQFQAGSAITAAGAFVAGSACVIDQCAGVSPSASFAGTISASSIAYVSAADVAGGLSGDIVSITAGSVMTATNGISLQTGRGGSLSIDAAASLNAGTAALSLFTDNLAFTGSGAPSFTAGTVFLGTGTNGIDTGTTPSILLGGTSGASPGLYLPSQTFATLATAVGSTPLVVGDSQAPVSIVLAGTLSAPATNLAIQTFNGTTTLDGSFSFASFGYAGAMTLAGDSSIATTGGGITLSGSIDGAQALTLADPSGTVSLSGTIIGSNTPLTSLTITAGSGIVLDNSITTSGNQSYNGPVVLAFDTALNAGLRNSDGSASTIGAIDFASTVDGSTAGQQELALSATGAITFGGAVGATNALGNFLLIAGSVTGVLPQFNATGSQTIDPGNTQLSGTYSVGTFIDGGAITLAGDTSLTATTGGIELSGTIDGAHALTLSAPTTGIVLGATPLRSSTPAPLTIGGATALTSLTVSPGGAIVLADDTAITAGSINLGATVDGAANLTLNATGLVALGQAIGAETALSSLTVNAGSTTLGGALITTGDQDYAGPVVLASNTTITSTGGSIHFAGTIDGTTAGQQSLTLSAANQLNLDQTVGGIVALYDFTATALQGSLPSIFTTHSQTINVGIGALTGTHTFTSTFTATGELTLAGDTTLTTTSGDINIGFGVAGAHALTLDDAVGTVRLTAGTDATNPIASLTVSAQDIVLGGAILTTGAQVFSGPVTLASNATISTAGSITLNGTVDGAHTLLLSGSGGTAINGAVGAVTALTGFSATGPISGGTLNVTAGTIALAGAVTTGTQTYTGATTLSGATYSGAGFETNGATTLAGAVTITSSGGITFGGTLDDLVARGGSLTLNAGTSDITFNGLVGNLAALGPVTIGSADDVTGPAAVQASLTSGFSEFRAVSFTAGTAANPLTGDFSMPGGLATTVRSNLTTASTSGSISIDTDGTVTIGSDNGNGGGLYIQTFGAGINSTSTTSSFVAGNGGAITIVGSSLKLASVQAGGGQSNSSSAASAVGGNGGNITLIATDGDIDIDSEYAGPGVATTGGASMLTAGGVGGTGGNIVISATGDVLVSTVATHGGDTLTGMGGNAGSITITGTTIALGRAIARGGDTAATGAGAGGGAGGSVTLIATGTGADAIILGGNNSDLSGTSTAVTYGSLTARSGEVGVTDLFNTDQGGTVTNAGGTVLLEGSAAGAALGGAVELVDTLTTSITLADGVLTFSNRGATTANAPSVSYDYGAAVVISASGAAGEGGAVQILGSIVAADADTENLRIGASNGSVSVTGSIGSSAGNKLGELALTGNGGAITIGGGVAADLLSEQRTSGSLTVEGNLKLGSYISPLGNTVLLTLPNAGNGGSTGNPGTVSLAGTFLLTTPLALGNQAVNLLGTTVLDTSTNNQPMVLGTVDGGFGLTLNAGTGTVTAGTIGGQTALSSLTINGGAISLGSVTTTGAQAYNGTTTFNGTYTGSGFTANGADLLGGATGVTVSSGNIGFGGTLDGAQNLVLSDANGTVTFSGAVGGTTALGSLTVTASGIVAGSIATTGAQSYSGALTVGGTYTAQTFTTAGPVTMIANTAINGGAGDITFGSTVQGQFNLALTSTDANIFFDGTVGLSTARLTLLSIAGANNATVENNSSLFVHDFVATNIGGTLTFGDHSLESDDVVTIQATSVDGRVISTTSATIDATSVSGIIQGSTVNVTATGAVNEQITADTATVSDGSFSGSVAATRGANIASTGDVSGDISVSGGSATVSGTNISGSVTSSGLAQISASQNVSADVTGGSVAIAAGGNVSGAVTATSGSVGITATNVSSTIVAQGGGTVDVTASNSITGSVSGGQVNLTAPTVNEAISASAANITATNVTVTGTIGGIDASAATSGASNITQEILGATQQVASNSSGGDTATADDTGTDDQAGDNDDEKKKKKKDNGAVYDFANQYIDNLIAGKKGN